MPRINQISLIEITPENFLESCSSDELKEVHRLIQTPRFRVRMDQPDADRRPADYPNIDDVINPITLTCY